MSRLTMCDICAVPIPRDSEPYVLAITHKIRGRTPTVKEQLRCVRMELCESCADRVATLVRGWAQ